MAGTGLVEGRSAGWLDIWRRILNLAAIAVPIVVGLILSGVGVPGPVLATAMIVLFVGLVVASIVAGQRVTRAMRRELEGGYSTLYDFADYELRDARTLELLRASNVPPQSPGRRSLVAGMFRVKPGTVLSQRIDEEKKLSDED